MILAATQAISRPIISFVRFFWTGFLNAVSRTNNENNIRKMPTPQKGTALSALNKVAKISGSETSKIPVIPELTAFINKTFFSIIFFEFCFPKGIFKSGFYYYLYTTSY